MRTVSARTMRRDSPLWSCTSWTEMAEPRLSTIAKKMSSTSHFTPVMFRPCPWRMPEYSPVLDLRRSRFSPRPAPHPG